MLCLLYNIPKPGLSWLLSLKSFNDSQSIPFTDHIIRAAWGSKLAAWAAASASASSASEPILFKALIATINCPSLSDYSTYPFFWISLKAAPSVISLKKLSLGGVQWADDGCTETIFDSFYFCSFKTWKVLVKFLLWEMGNFEFWELWCAVLAFINVVIFSY